MTTKTKLRLEAIEKRLDNIGDVKDSLRSTNVYLHDMDRDYRETIHVDLRDLTEKFSALSKYLNVEFVNNGLVCKKKEDQ